MCWPADVYKSSELENCELFRRQMSWALIEYFKVIKVQLNAKHFLYDIIFGFLAVQLSLPVALWCSDISIKSIRKIYLGVDTFLVLCLKLKIIHIKYILLYIIITCQRRNKINQWINQAKVHITTAESDRGKITDFTPNRNILSLERNKIYDTLLVSNL